MKTVKKLFLAAALILVVAPIRATDKEVEDRSHWQEGRLKRMAWLATNQQLILSTNLKLGLLYLVCKMVYKRRF